MVSKNLLIDPPYSDMQMSFYESGFIGIKRTSNAFKLA